jgi:integrase
LSLSYRIDRGTPPKKVKALLWPSSQASVVAAGYLFMSGRSKVGDPISGFSKAKTNLDKWLVADGQILEPWSYHDLRRTVRTHLSRINVAPGVAERVLNHTPQGVEAIYDRHQYLEEKRQALEAWSKAVGTMLDGDDGTVAYCAKTGATAAQTRF